MNHRFDRNIFATFAQTFAFFAVKKISITFLIIISLSPCFVLGQEAKLSEEIVSIAEELAADDSDPQAAESYIDRFYELAENPVNINSSDEKEISRLFFLSDFQIKAIADYIKSTGRIISVYELANIPGFDKETTELIIPFISITGTVKRDPDPVRMRNTLLTNFSIRPGNTDSISLGSQWKILTKYKFIAGSFSGGFTSEKDPGEKFFSGNTSVPDFLSAYFTYKGNGFVRKLIIGDYSARFGQGTAINTGFRTALSPTAQGYMSARDEIRSYTSTDENNFLRGVAAELNLENMGLTLFYSKNYPDANLGSLSGSSEDYIENFYKAGIHNTNSLLRKKDAVSETVSGINLSYHLSNLKLGMVWLNNGFSLPLITEENKPEKIFNFSGKRNNIYTLYYNSLIKRILIFGEFSINETNAHAFVQGLSFRPSDRLAFNWLYRNYNSGFFSFHGNGPGHNSVTGNEQGILANFTFEAAKHLFISGGCDSYYFPWLKYRCSSPSMGKRQEIRVKYLPTEKIIIEASYNHRVSMTDGSDNTGIPQLVRVTGNSIKGTFRYSVTENFKITSRVDYKITDPSGSRGMLLLQDLNYMFRSVPVTIWARYCIFNTDNWESRLYTYENDLLYCFSIPALSGSGSRSYIMAKWEIGDFAELRVKYGLTSQVENMKIPEYKDEAKVQFMVWF